MFRRLRLEGLVVLMASGPAMAAEAGGVGFERLVYHAINVAIFLGLVVYFGGKGIRRSLKQRAANVTKEIEEASALHAQARARLDEYETRLTGLKREADELLAELRREGEAEKARIIAEARAEADRIQRDAERAARGEIDRARRRLEGELVDRAIDRALGVIKDQITPADQRRLAADYLARLEERS